MVGDAARASRVGTWISPARARLQANDFNKSRIATVIVVALTSNTRLADAPGNVLLLHQATGLPKDSTANVSQVVTIDKSFLVERVGALSRHLLAQVEEGLRLAMSL